jgi:hypothetical protein
MHWRTYRRLVAELGDLRWEFYGCLAVEFRFDGFEHPEGLEEGDLGYRQVRPYRRRNLAQIPF